MSRVVVTDGTSVGGSRAILQPPAAGREVPVTEGPTSTAHVRSTVDTGDTHPDDARVSLVATDRDHAAERLDATAGCEFVDDRIRLTE